MDRMIFHSEWDLIREVIDNMKPDLDELPTVNNIEKALTEKIESLITVEEYEILDELFDGRDFTYLTIYARRENDKTVFNDRYIDGLKLHVLVHCSLNKKNYKWIIKRLNSTNIPIIDEYFKTKEENRIKSRLFEIKYQNFNSSRLSQINKNILDETGKNYEEIFRERDEKYFKSLLEIFPKIDNQTKYKFKVKGLSSRQVSTIEDEVISITNNKLIEVEPSDKEAVKALSKITSTAFLKTKDKSKKAFIELVGGNKTELDFVFKVENGKVIFDKNRRDGYTIRIKTFDIGDSSDYYYAAPSKKMLAHVEKCLNTTKEGKILSDFIIKRNEWLEKLKYFRTMTYVFNGIESTEDFVGSLGKIITYLYNREEVSPKYKRLIKGLIDEPLS